MARRADLLQPDPERIGHRERRGACLFPVRPSPSRWRGPRPEAGQGAEGAPADPAVRATPPLQYSDHQIGRGRDFYEQACGLKLEGIISKQADAPYAPGNRGLWLKVKCLNREEFVVVGWTDPEKQAAVSGAHCCSLLRPRWSADLRGPRRDRHRPRGA